MEKFLNIKLAKCAKRKIKFDIRSKIRIGQISLFIFSSIKYFLDKFSDFYGEYQGKTPPEDIAEVLRDYADSLDGLC